MHNSLMNVLQQIFTDYYEEIEYTLHPRKTEMENIDKMIHSVIHLSVVPCTAVLTAESLKLSSRLQR